MLSSKKGLRNEQQFAKLETQKGERFYLFSDWKGHPVAEKKDFPLGTFFLFSDKYKDTIWNGEMNSRSSFNSSLEWNFSYLKKVRAACTNQIKNCKYILQKCNADEEDDDFDSYMVFKIHFKMQNEVEILAFQAKLFPNYVSNPYNFLLEKLADFNTSKNKDLDAHERQINTVQSENTTLLSINENLTKLKVDLEKELLNKFIVLLNPQKKQIRELEEKIKNFRRGSANSGDKEASSTSQVKVEETEENSEKDSKKKATEDELAENELPESQMFYQSFGDTQTFQYNFNAMSLSSSAQVIGASERMTSENEQSIKEEEDNSEEVIRQVTADQSLSDLFQDGSSGSVPNRNIGKKRRIQDL